MGRWRTLSSVVGLVAALLTVALVGVAPAASAAPRFSDVPPTNSFSADIDWLVGRGITGGYADGTYRPGAPVTRQAMALFLYRFAHPGAADPTCPAGAGPFDDVPSSAAACGAIRWLVGVGVTTGYSNGDFKPAARVSREAMALFLYRLSHGSTPAPACSRDAFPDVHQGDSACGATRWLVDQGVTAGYSDGGFHPLSAVTRGAMAAFLHRYDGVLRARLGADVSYPQCPSSRPSGQAFAVVGVNGGVANTTNPCLNSELAWAQTSNGGTAQPLVQLYVNTANPGKGGASVWPTTGRSDRYGTCSGGDDRACAYQYGQMLAEADVYDRGVPAPETFTWWLDVETSNTWLTGTAGQAKNVAALEGMVDYFLDAGVVDVGLYSTGLQWAQITGSGVASDSPLTGRPSWIAGVGDITSAWRGCAAPALTAGGQVVMAQFIEGGFDRDHSCG